jgi:hypothetical protein
MGIFGIDFHYFIMVFLMDISGFLQLFGIWDGQGHLEMA